MKSKKKVLVALSGGVDSSVAAALLKQEGYEVVAGHIKINSVDENCSRQDVVDARRVAETLNIPFYVFDFNKQYYLRVIDYFVRTYQVGKTPNPDVLCNKEIKFGVLLEKAKSLGFDYIATGHYARLKSNNDNDVSLLRGVDNNKDQSYFLWQLSSDQLKFSLFPIGDLPKEQVRNLASQFKLPTAEKKDSQGICFLGDVRVKDFLSQYLDIKGGEILLPSGEVVGQHDGAVFYTIGQRHGFDLASSEAGIKTGEPLFIVEKDIKKNTITVAPGRNNSLLYKKIIWLEDIHFIISQIPNDSEIEVQIRYRQQPQKAIFRFDKIKSSFYLDFSDFQSIWAPAIGQHAVFYNKNNLLGGGVIKSIE